MDNTQQILTQIKNSGDSEKLLGKFLLLTKDSVTPYQLDRVLRNITFIEQLIFDEEISKHLDFYVKKRYVELVKLFDEWLQRDTTLEEREELYKTTKQLLELIEGVPTLVRVPLVQLGSPPPYTLHPKIKR